MGSRDHADRRLARRDAMRGQALLELALVTPLVALLLFGAIQFGLIFERQIGINNAVREVARRAAALSTTNANVQVNANGAKAWLDAELTNAQGFSASDIRAATACYTTTTADPAGNPQAQVTITVTYSHPLFLPIISGILDGMDGFGDGKFDTSASSVFRVESPIPTVLTTPSTCNA